METKNTKASNYSANGTDYLRFEGLKIGRKVYEVVLLMTPTTHITEVYLCTKNNPPAYIANPDRALLTKLSTRMAA